MSPEAFVAKVLWIRRRARRIQRFYGISRPLAVFDAHLDWVRFNGLTLPATVLPANPTPESGARNVLVRHP